MISVTSLNYIFIEKHHVIGHSVVLAQERSREDCQNSLLRFLNEKFQNLYSNENMSQSTRWQQIILYLSSIGGFGFLGYIIIVYPIVRVCECKPLIMFERLNRSVDGRYLIKFHKN